MHFVPSQLGKSFNGSQLGSLIHLWQASWLTEASWSKGMLTRMTWLYSICSFSPQQVSPGLYTWWSQGPKSETHIKASWGQAQNLQFPFHRFFKSNQVARAAQIEGYIERDCTSSRKERVCGHFCHLLYLLWGTLIHEDTTMRLKVIHNLGHKFSPQTLLSSRFLPCYSFCLSVVSHLVRDSLRNFWKFPWDTKPCNWCYLLA